MYTVFDYGTMILKGPRVERYLAALEKAIKPGCTVLELGCGPGFFTLQACRLGAGRVYAVEPDSAIAVAREAAAANGLADRIEFFQKMSTEVSLSEPADVIVSDMRGVLPLLTQHIPSIVDARARLLKPGGTQIALCDTLWAAPVDDAKTHRGYAEPWEPRDGFTFDAARRVAANQWRKAKVDKSALLAEPVAWTKIDYRTVESPHVTGRCSWQVERAGTLHGFSVWFDSELAEGITLTNAPGKEELVYGQAFMPLLDGVAVDKGDRVGLELRAQLVGDDYIWTWNTSILDAAGKPRARFAQSSMQGLALTPTALRKRDLNGSPELGEDGAIAAEVLSRFKGKATLEAIATELLEAYPKRFKNQADARKLVGDLAVVYAK